MWLDKGVAKKEIARRLGRDIKTIRRELTRNKTRVAVGDDWQMLYEPLHAQHVAMQRKQNAFDAKQPLRNKKTKAKSVVLPSSNSIFRKFSKLLQSSLRPLVTF